jgi:hypothetical protein
LSLLDGEGVMRETKKLEFKSTFDPNSLGDWCELIKDIAAMANSGGGEIVIGLNNDGSPSGAEVGQLLSTDVADIDNKLESYIGTIPPDIRVERLEKQGYALARIVVGGTAFPMVFVKQGSYSTPYGKTKTAFAKGTVYFRHGPKSEPAVPRDFEVFINKELRRRRRELFGNIKQIISAPVGSRVALVPVRGAKPERGQPLPFRLSDDPNAIAVRGLVDDSPYQSLRDELTGVVKAWKTDPMAFAAETQLSRLYSQRRALKLDNEDRTCLLTSAVHRHAPFFYWAADLPRDTLVAVIRNIISMGRYPGPNMAAKLAHALGGLEGETLLRDIADSDHISASNVARRLLQSVGDEDRIEKVYGSPPPIARATPQGIQFIYLSTEAEQEAEDLFDELLAGRVKVDKQKTKRIDAWLYAPRLKG